MKPLIGDGIGMLRTELWEREPMLSEWGTMRVSRKKIGCENQQGPRTELGPGCKSYRIDRERRNGSVPASCPSPTDMPKTFRSPE